MKKSKLQWTPQKYKRSSKDHRLPQQLYANKMDNMEEMDKFLERYNLLRLNQKEIENMNWSVTSTEIETVIKKLPTNKSPGPDGFTGEFYQTLTEELTPILLKLLQKSTEEEILPTSFYEATITLITEPQIPQKKRKHCRLISLMDIDIESSAEY